MDTETENATNVAEAQPNTAENVADVPEIKPIEAENVTEAADAKAKTTENIAEAPDTAVADKHYEPPTVKIPDELDNEEAHNLREDEELAGESGDEIPMGEGETFSSDSGSIKRSPKKGTRFILEDPDIEYLNLSMDFDLSELETEDLAEEHTEEKEVTPMTTEKEIEAGHEFSDDENDKEYLARGPVRGDTIKAKANFLAHFDMPSIDDISDEEEIKPRRSRKSTLSGSSILSRGRVSTGGSNQTVESTSSESAQSSESTSRSDKTLDTDIEFPPYIDWYLKSRVPKPPELDADEISFIQFQVADYGDEARGSDDEFDKMRMQRALEQINAITAGFLDDIINDVVVTVNNRNVHDILRTKLDKVKLHSKLVELREKYMFEKELNTYINNRMVDYYKRLKNFRVFSNLEPHATLKEYRRYMTALTQLDRHLEVAGSTKKKIAVFMSSVQMDLSHITNIVLNTEEHFETTMLSICHEKSEFIKRLIERELRLMNSKRNEISDTRLSLITRKHTLARIVDKITKLQQINEKLCMDDFITIQNQVVALDKKIEDRNCELKRMHLSYHTDLHLTQHNREKTLMLFSKLHAGKFELRKLVSRQHELRANLYTSKLERSAIHKEHSDLIYQGGLLSMPALMEDYDYTIKKMEEKQESLKELKENFKRITQRIEELESRCA